MFLFFVYTNVDSLRLDSYIIKNSNENVLNDNNEIIKIWKQNVPIACVAGVQYINLQIENETLKQELSEKQELLKKAS